MKSIPEKTFVRITPFNLKKYLKETTARLAGYALKKKIEVYQVFPGKNILLLKKKRHFLWLRKTQSSLDNPNGIKIAKDKHKTKMILKQLSLPFPRSYVIQTKSDLIKSVQEIGYPCIIKPVSLSEGKGITPNIRNKKTLLESFDYAQTFEKSVLIEKYLPFDYYRITFIKNNGYAAVLNKPARVVGNGISSVEKLIKEENLRREKEERKNVKKIPINEKVKRIMKGEGYNLKSIPPEKSVVPLSFSGYDGGEYINVTGKVNNKTLRMIEGVSDFLQLPIIGIDIIAKDIRQPLTKSNGAIIEINATDPDLDFHFFPTQGESIDLAKNIIDLMDQNL
jgi:cyanophycin synthetase